jgi:hypothetical protein
VISELLARSIHKLKDKDPPAAKCGDPLVKRVQKRSASFCKEKKMNSPLNKGRCRKAEGIFFISGMINIFYELSGLEIIRPLKIKLVYRA